MPIYEYRCTSCGFEKEHLQKLGDPVLTACPHCHAETYTKKVSVAGFQLKGKGWYATDFKGGASSGAKDDAPSASPPPCQGGHGACSCC